MLEGTLKVPTLGDKRVLLQAGLLLFPGSSDPAAPTARWEAGTPARPPLTSSVSASGRAGPGTVLFSHLVSLLEAELENLAQRPESPARSQKLRLPAPAHSATSSEPG